MILINNDYFDLAKIADSGQCFRWRERECGVFEVSAFDRVLRMSQDGNMVSLDCSDEDYADIWHNYFDLDADYEQYHLAAVNSPYPYLAEAAKFSKGIRILRQDLWEMVFSYIISQQNNIPRIKLCIERVVERFGHFPRQFEVVRGSLAGLGLGYREDYLYCAAEQYAPDLEDFRVIRGVGDKVANCIELFGRGRKDAFPRDVWVKRIEKEHFNGHFPEEEFPEFAGVLQQFMFYAARNNTKE